MSHDDDDDAFDYRGARRQLAQLQTGDALDVAAILRQRARKLAEPPPRAAAADLELVRFGSAHVGWAIESRFVRALVRAERVVALPGAPAFVPGVSYLRGDLVMVVDLSALVGAPSSVGSLGTPLLLIVGETRDELALLTGDDVDVLPLASTQLLAAADAVDADKRRLVRGVTRDGVTVIDGEALLADPRLVFGPTRS